MKKEKLYLILFFLMIVFVKANAQFDYLNIYGGTVFYPQKEKTGSDGYSESVFGGYNQGIKVGASVEKYFTDNIGASANIDYTITSKTRYSMSQLKLDLQLKYSFFRYNTLSPYVFAGPNVSFFSIKQDRYDDPNFHASPFDSSANVIYIQSTSQYRYGEISAIFVPVLGFVGGAGLSVRVNEWFSVFGEYAFNYYLNKQSSFPKEYFPHNNTNLSNSTIQAGVKIDLY